MKISKKTLEQVEENRDLIESKDWLKIWMALRNPELNGAFVELGYNPLSGLKEIPSAYFSGSPVKSVVIPDSVTSIGRLAFWNCSSLKSIIISNSLTSIGESAFYKCSALTELVIGDSVTSIEEEAFYGCTSLTSIKYNGTKKQWENISKGDNWNDEIPATKVICNDGEVDLI